MADNAFHGGDELRVQEKAEVGLFGPGWPPGLEQAKKRGLVR
jgi:hypothetical protein